MDRWGWTFPIFWNFLGICSTEFDSQDHCFKTLMSWTSLQRGQQCFAQLCDLQARVPTAIKVDDPFSSAPIWQFLPVEVLVCRLSHEFGSFLGLELSQFAYQESRKNVFYFFPYRLQANYASVFKESTGNLNQHWMPAAGPPADTVRTQRETSVYILILLFSTHLILDIL